MTLSFTTPRRFIPAHTTGCYGRWPGLAVASRYEGRDLAVTTDFRDVFGEIVVRHLGVADPSPIFPGHPIKAANFAGLFA